MLIGKFKKFKKQHFESQKSTYSLIVLIMAFFILLVPAVRFLFFQNYFKENASFYNTHIASSFGRDEKIDSTVYGGRELHYNPYHYFLYISGKIFQLENSSIFIPIILGFFSALLFYNILEKFKVDSNTTVLAILIFLVSPTFIYVFSASTPLCLIFFLGLLGVFLFIQESKLLFFLSLPVFSTLSLFGFAVSLTIFAITIILNQYFRKSSGQFYSTLAVIIVFALVGGIFLKSTIVFQNPENSNFVKEFFSDFGGNVGFSIFTVILAFFGVVMLWKNKEKNYLAFLLFFILLFASFADSFFNIFLIIPFSLLASYAIISISRSQWEITVIKNLTILVIFCGIIFSSISYYNNHLKSAPSQDMITALKFLNEKANKAYTIFSDEKNGFLIEYYGGTVFADTLFSKERLSDEKTIYYSRKVEVTKKILDKYHVGYILIDKNMREKIWVSEDQGLLFLLKNSDSFRKIYNIDSVEVWEYLGK